MTEQELLDLGFTEVNVSFEESGGEPFKYYELDFGGGLSLISNADCECIDGKYTVEIFDYSIAKFDDAQALGNLIYIIKSAIK
jgi:hypothetical protein